jgi:hypothetical protein
MLSSIQNCPDIADALVLGSLDDGTWREYRLLHTGNVGSILGASKIVTGTYTGNAGSDKSVDYVQNISLGFTPKAVLVNSSRNIVDRGNYGGGDGTVIAVTGSPVKPSGAAATILVEIVDGGFTAHGYGTDATESSANRSGELYRYVAFG